MDNKQILLNLSALGPLIIIGVFAYSFFNTEQLILKIVLVIGIVFFAHALFKGFKYINK